MADTTRPAFLGQIGAVNPMGGDTSQGPHQNPNFTQGGAPAGRFFSEAEFPVTPISGAGMPMTTSGFRATDASAPLPPPGSSVGSPMPPKR